MALNQTERTLIAGWAEQVRTAASWESGARQKQLTNLADQMDAVAEDGAKALEEDGKS